MAHPRPPGRSLDLASDGETRGMVVSAEACPRADRKVCARAGEGGTEFGLRSTAADLGTYVVWLQTSGYGLRASGRVRFQA